MNVLSLFDGMSCAQIALNRAEIKYKNYFSSEIDKFAIKVTQSNYPNTTQLGDIKNIKGINLPKIDLLIGGSPCQGFSFAGKKLNFQDPRSKLFFEFVRLLKELNPLYFLLENVKMKKEHEQVISKILEIEPIKINSSLVSAQNRERLYWTDIKPIIQPTDKKIFLKDIIEPNSRNFLSDKTASRPRAIKNLKAANQKANCLLATSFKLAQANGMTNIIDGGKMRCLSPIECERLQTVPDNYTNYVSNTQRYKMLGNGFTVDIICHIFKSMKLKELKSKINA